MPAGTDFGASLADFLRKMAPKPKEDAKGNPTPVPTRRRCKWFDKNGRCKYGDRCRDAHARGTDSSSNGVATAASPTAAAAAPDPEAVHFGPWTTDLLEADFAEISRCARVLASVPGSHPDAPKQAERYGLCRLKQLATEFAAANPVLVGPSEHAESHAPERRIEFVFSSIGAQPGVRQLRHHFWAISHAFLSFALPGTRRGL